MARMKSVLWIVVVVFASPCWAHSACDSVAVSRAAAMVARAQQELRQNQVADMDTNVPPAVADQMMRLREALGVASDAVLACEESTVDVNRLRKSLIQTLHASEPVPEGVNSISKGDSGYEEMTGSYGHNLQVEVMRPAAVARLLEVEYSINIACGSDTMLLVYELREGHWRPRIRWQSPPLKQISDAFGDFFVSTILPGSTSSSDSEPKWQLVVAHGRPWCSSRMSGFEADLITPGSSPPSPHVAWHIEREYSRGGDFEPRIRSVGKIFEFRINADCMEMDSANCFERRVIYRYQVDGDDHVSRIGPMGLNARGFVHEWLRAPWEESQNLAIDEARAELQKVHQEFVAPAKFDSSKYVSHSYGPVRACATPGVFQVQINSTLETEVPGKPDGESKPLPSHYFHVREGKDGYVMVSAPTEPDPSCTGADLMPQSDGAI